MPKHRTHNNPAVTYSSATLPIHAPIKIIEKIYLNQEIGVQFPGQG
jgi:hypothetical protein